MNDPTLDRIRDANPYPDALPPLPIEPVRRRIAEGSSPSVPRRRIPVPDFGSVVAGLGAALAIGIAVFVIVTIGHPHRGGTRVGSPGVQVTGIAAERQQLISSLAVLRRAQSSADRTATLPSPFFTLASLPAPVKAQQAAFHARQRKQAGDPTVDQPLLRAVRTSAGDEISVVPETWQPSPTSSARAEGIAIAIHTPGNQQAVDTGPRPVSVNYFETHGLAVFNDTRRGAVLIPDGVARVTLVGFGAVSAGGHITMDNATIAGRTAKVHDNLATFTLAGLTATSPSGSSDLGGGVQVRMVWFDASGHVVAHTATEFSTLYITVRAAAGSQSAAGTTLIGKTKLTPEMTTGAFRHTTGVANVIRTGDKDGLVLALSGLPKPSRGTAYGVWLLNAVTDRDTFLGFIATSPVNGYVSAEVVLPPLALRRYSSVELTIEHGERPKSHPGQPVLRGKLP